METNLGTIAFVSKQGLQQIHNRVKNILVHIIGFVYL